MASLLLCQRIGCSARYSEDSNGDESCHYHSSPPVFHDGSKEWPCCGKRSHDFALFMDIPGCSRGRHSQEKPVKAAAVPPPSLAPVKLAAAQPAAQPVDRAACPRCRQGFYCSEHAQVGAPVEPASAAPPPPLRAPGPAAAARGGPADLPHFSSRGLWPGPGPGGRLGDRDSEAAALAAAVTVGD
jgi:disease resistance protein